MGKDWLHWIVGGGGGSRNCRSATKKEAAESASAGCMCAVFHLFHSHHLQCPPSHRNHSHSHSHPHPHPHPFLQEEASTTRGVEAPRNSLELEQENLNFPVGIIQIKTKLARLDEISSNCSSPSTKTPIVARLMGLDDLLTQSTTPSISSSSPKCKRFLRRGDDDGTLAARSLPETPRVSSSSSRRSDVERHRLSLQINEELVLSDHRVPGRRSRFKQNENRNPVQGVVKHGGKDNSTTTTTTTTRRVVGADITNTSVVQSRRDENLLVLHKPAKKNSNNHILSKHHDDSFASSGPRILLFSDHDMKTKTTTSSSCENRIPSSQKDCKRVGFGARCSSSARLRKLPPRAAADRAVRGSRETNKSNLRDRNLQVKKFKGPSPPPTKLPQKQSSQVSSKSRTQLSSKPSQSYSLTPPQTVSSCDDGAALHGGSSPEQRNYIQIILKHTGIINHANPLAKWHTPSHPIDPGIFHYLELSAAVEGGDAVLSLGCNRKLIFQLVDELLAEVLTPRFSLRRWVSPGGGGGGGFPMVEELCKKIDSFPAAKCVVLEDIDSLIDTDLCKSRLNGCLGEEEEVVREIESEMVEWLVREAVAVMGGDAAAEEQTETRVLFGWK